MQGGEQAVPIPPFTLPQLPSKQTRTGGVGTRDPSLFGILSPNLNPLGAISHLCCKHRNEKSSGGSCPQGAPAQPWAM